MLKIVVFLCVTFLFAKANIVQNPSYSFITKGEYGKLLYQNPRGIGCHLCHGSKGEGMFIASYKHKGKTINVSAPDIRNLDFKAFKKAMNTDKLKSVMPKYFLTDDEIDSIYFFIKNQKEK
jgi:mono/diheme cytochrome c family protein